MQNTLFIPVILGTARKDSMSHLVTEFIESLLNKVPHITTEIVDPGILNLPGDGNDDSVRNSTYTDSTKRADGFIIVVPEYNHSFPGSLKRLLDSEFDNYYHKPVAFAGVSSGTFGGSRAIESLLPVVRALGLVACTKEVNFGNVKDVINKEGVLIDDAFIVRTQRMIDELLWMTKALKHQRELTNTTPKGGDS